MTLTRPFGPISPHRERESLRGDPLETLPAVAWRDEAPLRMTEDGGGRAMPIAHQTRTKRDAQGAEDDVLALDPIEVGIMLDSTTGGMPPPAGCAFAVSLAGYESSSSSERSTRVTATFATP